MRVFASFVLLLAATAVFAQNDQLPKAQVFTLQGQSADIATFVKPEKITVLNFWATWCSPCKKELDNIAELYEDWQKEYNVELIACTIDDARSLTKVGPMVEAKGWTYTILSDKNEDLRRALNFQNVPYTFVIKDNKIVYTHSGYVEGAEYELEEVLKKLAGK
jgi:cytochrome c biogenesis protein CcmG/thiol:disulfide interchange protein DsbE